MSHLFSEAVGVCVKTYLCWQRMHRAFAQIENGQSLTQIAMGAGYADLSHFGREFREFATMPLSRWLRHVTVRQIEYESPPSCESHTEKVPAPHSSTLLTAAIRGAALRI
jgi:AraC-like DNA-binding protein